MNILTFSEFCNGIGNYELHLQQSGHSVAGFRNLDGMVDETCERDYLTNLAEQIALMDAVHATKNALCGEWGRFVVRTCAEHDVDLSWVDVEPYSSTEKLAVQ